MKSWYQALANRIESHGGRRDIFRMVDGKPELYLVRYYILKSKWCEIVLHNFYLSDMGVLHDHPWSSISVILKTGYWEYINREIKVRRKPWKISGRNATALHRVELMPHTEGQVWTMFITFRRKKLWYFDVPGRGMVEALQYMKEKKVLVHNSLPGNFSNGLFPKRIG